MIDYNKSFGNYVFLNYKGNNFYNALIFRFEDEKLAIKLFDFDISTLNFEIDDSFKYFDDLNILLKHNETLLLEDEYCFVKIIRKKNKIVFNFNKKNMLFDKMVVTDNEKIISKFNKIFSSIEEKNKVKKTFTFRKNK